MKHCQRDQLLEATLPSHDFISTFMIFSAFNRASAFQPLNMSYKLPKTKYKPKFSGLDFISDKKPKYVTLNY